MKNQLLLLAAAGLFLASCGDGKTSSSNATTETKTETTTTSTTTAQASSDIPNFSTPELKTLAQEYTNYMKESAEAAKSGNADKIKELQTKATDWASKTQTAMTKMTAEDAKMWTDYFTKLSQDLAK